MKSLSWVRSLACVASITFISGCGGHSARSLAPDAATDVAATSGDQIVGTQPPAGALACSADYLGPVLTISGPGVEYTYPTGGYFVGPEFEVPIPVEQDKQVRFRWSADASSGCTEARAYRWALDIEDLTDETPRIDENTDLAHWSAWSRATTAKLDKFVLTGSPPANVHYFYIDATDQLGYRSLGIFRITAVGSGNPPGPTAKGVGDGEF
jgi:hypothetical protein